VNGHIRRWPKEQVYTGNPEEIGYNQVLEELFEAYEERLPPRMLEAYIDSPSASLPRKLIMDHRYEEFNPATQHLSLDWKYAPACKLSFVLCCIILAPKLQISVGDAMEASSCLQHI
jgi:hypothetical protein